MTSLDGLFDIELSQLLLSQHVLSTIISTLYVSNKGRLLILNGTLLKGRLWNVQEMERIYVKCKEHDKAFTSTQLILHAELTRKQTGEKSFKCAMCAKEFTISRKLTAHMTGEKLYKCKECNKAFSTTSNLADHTYR